MTTTALAFDRFNNPIQALQPGVTQKITTATGASARTGAGLRQATVVVRLVATTDCYVQFGPAASVDATAASMFVVAGVPEYFRVPWNSGWGIAAIAADMAGVLHVTEMA